MSWFKRLFNKCCDDCKPCGNEKQEMDPVDEPETEAPEEPVGGEETSVVE